ncbi:GNAT family N-acetyltransferase [Denitrobaculum tricleocarpae]|uniref:GNAT family N-acetyltransferase n=1 Tax=Denitrobaculum tricleocarpae TaxID=2591009 RepID=A0A545T3X1_9PROT|nr:GNAT family N-acetyltransferase [Denitrobaculum tricleocarpae]TQV71921.1 GNAT family N-acetyltransferase [Denitrobaculum tricleocarpae]
MTLKHWQCRLATPADEVHVVALQVECTHQLGLAFHKDLLLSSYIREIGGLDKDLINRRTYYVVEQDNHIIGSGGWSDRRGRPASDLEAQKSKFLPPCICTVFVDPDYIRRGVGTAILNAAEEDIRLAGYHSAELVTILSAVNFYASHGYRKLDNSVVELSNGSLLPAIRMSKHFDDHKSGDDVKASDGAKKGGDTQPGSGSHSES